MEYLGTAVATWMLNNLLDKLKDVAIKAVLGSAGVDREVGDLKNALMRADLILGAVLAAAASGSAGISILDKKLVEPINEVHRLAAQLANHLDEVEYECIKAKVKAKNLKYKNSKLKSRMTRMIDVGKTLPIIDNSGIQRIKVIVEHLQQNCTIVYEALNFLKEATENTSTDARETAAINTETKVFSREESNGIQQLITASASSEELLVLPIVGDGGVGKTTLARQVYNDDSVRDKFSIMIWVYVSANFDEVKITQGILEQIPECDFKNTKNLNVLQGGIKKYLTKRFLLVLDDMWEESEGRWDKLLAPLRFTKDENGVMLKGNVILVTTRKLSVAKVTNRMEARINLDAMKEDMFWLFFKRCIFGDENYQGNKMLLSVGKDISIKLKGNPLAAKSVGSLLRRKFNYENWRKISASDVWKIENKTDDIIPALRLSYSHLSSRLQLLFSYCAVFPKGYKFDKDQLIRMWIALGLVTDDRKKLEDAGRDNFDDLVDGSFFQKDGQSFVMHDLIHDVAQEVSVSKCLTIDSPKDSKFFDSLRLDSICHVGIWTDLVYKEQSMKRNENYEDMLDIIQNTGIVGTLESLMLVGVYDENFSAKFLKTLEQLHYIRLLRLSAMPFNVEGLLSSVKKFIHLRYLELRSTSDVCKPLPDAICKLYHLLVLDIIHWSGLNDLPKGMSNLMNLRYLLVPGSGSLHSKLSRVGELKFLQELNEFRVQKQSGFEISQLGSLNGIKGSLRILDLENATEEEASRARIKDKEDLRTLSLSWGSARGNPAAQKEVIEGLKPHDYLSHLHIINYAGVTPSWLGDENFAVSNLESLQLQDCTAVEILPPFEKLQFLKKLSLIGMSSLKTVNIDFKCDDNEVELSEVEIENCSALMSIRLHFAKVLTRFDVKDCGALSSIESLPSSDKREHYDVQGCPQLPAVTTRKTVCKIKKQEAQLARKHVAMDSKATWRV